MKDLAHVLKVRVFHIFKLWSKQSLWRWLEDLFCRENRCGNQTAEEQTCQEEEMQCLARCKCKVSKKIYLKALVHHTAYRKPVWSWMCRTVSSYQRLGRSV